MTSLIVVDCPVAGSVADSVVDSGADSGVGSAADSGAGSAVLVRPSDGSYLLTTKLFPATLYIICITLWRSRH